MHRLLAATAAKSALSPEPDMRVGMDISGNRLPVSGIAV
jgi:hypothetical protein